MKVSDLRGKPMTDSYTEIRFCHSSLLFTRLPA